MTIQPIEVEARALVEQYRNADGSPGNYYTDIIAGLLDALDDRGRQLDQARATVSELSVKLAEARRRPGPLITAVEAALTELRPTENGFPRNAHCARSRLREAITDARS